MWSTIGHDRVVDLLARSIEAGRASHAYLLAGPSQVGKMTVATELASALNCLSDAPPCGECDQCERIARAVHADVRVVGPGTAPTQDGRSRVLVGIDQVRDVQREASLKPYEGACRVFIFDRAERLSEEASNSLLKTLEEPPDQVVLVLLAQDAEALLPTLVSRCQVLELRPVPRTTLARELMARYELDDARADEIARVSGGRPGWAIEAATHPDVLERLAERLGTIEQVVKGTLEERFAYAEKLASIFGRDRDAVRDELDSWSGWWRDVLVVKEQAPDLVTHPSRLETLTQAADALPSTQVAGALEAIQQTQFYLERNANPRLALEELMLRLPRS